MSSSCRKLEDVSLFQNTKTFRHCCDYVFYLRRFVLKLLIAFSEWKEGRKYFI